MRVILIEDDTDISFIYKRQLEKENLPTDAFATGNEALAALANTLYDIALIDMMLPDTNGIEILKQIKANEKFKNMTTIILTNMGQESIIQEATQLGVDGYLIKSSMTPGQLISQILAIYKKKTTPPAQPQGQS